MKKTVYALAIDNKYGSAVTLYESKEALDSDALEACRDEWFEELGDMPDDWEDAYSELSGVSYNDLYLSTDSLEISFTLMDALRAAWAAIDRFFP